MQFDLSVVIPFLPTDTHLMACLTSLEKQKNLSIEVLMIINPKTSVWPILPPLNLKIRKLSSEKGANRARNVGLQAAKTDLVFFLDSDCILDNELTLKKYVDEMTKYPQLTACGGPYTLSSEANVCTRAYHQIQSAWLRGGIYSKQNFTDHLMGGNLVLRKSKLQTAKFDEQMIFGSTEYELLDRLAKRGDQFMFFADQAVKHISSISKKDLIYKARCQGEGFRHLKKQNGDVLTREKTLLPEQDHDQSIAPFIQIYFESFVGESSRLKLLLQKIKTLKRISNL